MVEIKIKDIPKMLNIMSAEWDIDFIDDMREVDPGGSSAMGYCDYKDKKLTIYNSKCPVENVKSLVHELIHAMCYEHNMLEIQDHDASERIIDSLANAAVDTLVRNKLIKFSR